MADMTFKEAADKLESIVSSLESGELELEASLASYKQGCALLGLLKQKIDDAEKEIAQLSEESTQSTRDSEQVDVSVSEIVEEEL